MSKVARNADLRMFEGAIHPGDVCFAPTGVERRCESFEKEVRMKKRDDIKTHTHIDENGHEYTHTHEDHDHVHAHDNNTHEGHDHSHSHHSHSHTHDPKEMKKIINRISKSIGHMESIKRMLENGEDCADVLVQIAAVKSEINNAGKALLKEHLDHCIVEAVAQNDTESVDKMNKAIDYFMK